MPDDTPGLNGLTPRPETRSDQRQRMLKGGSILGEDGTEQANCLIRNLSDSGARLEIQADAPVQERFILVMPDGKRRPVETAWTSGQHCGVRFCDLDAEAGIGGPAQRMLARIDAIEEQLAELRNDLLVHLRD